MWRCWEDCLPNSGWPFGPCRAARSVRPAPCPAARAGLPGLPDRWGASLGTWPADPFTHEFARQPHALSHPPPHLSARPSPRALSTYAPTDLLSQSCTIHCTHAPLSLHLIHIINYLAVYPRTCLLSSLSTCIPNYLPDVSNYLHRPAQALINPCICLLIPVPTSQPTNLLIYLLLLPTCLSIILRIFA